MKRTYITFIAGFLLLLQPQESLSTPYNSISSIDGIVDGEWSEDELRVDDPNDDSGWNSELNEIDDIYLTWDENYLYIGVKGYTESFNAIHIAIDINPGENTGETDFSTGYQECHQNCKTIEDGFGAEFMYASDGMEPGEFYLLDPVEKTEAPIDATASAHSFGLKGYEIKVGWNSLFELGEGVVPQGCKIAIVAILGNAQGNYCSRETAPDWVNGSYSEGFLVFDRSSTIVVDSDGNGVPDNLTQTVILLEDSVGDDYGPGSYEYPLNPVFTQGSFDFTSFEVFSTTQRIYFVFGISGEIDDPWGSGGGFSLQNIDLYIDKDGIDGSGATYTLEGRNASIASNSGWEAMIWCAPPFDDFKSCLIHPDGTQDTSGVVVTVDTVKDEISVSLPVEKIGDPDTNWAYIVLMLSQDGYSSGRVRPVNAEQGQWVFGGGDDTNFDSNIIDMVVSPGLSQEGMLANYDPVVGLQPVLYARPDTLPPTIVHTPVVEAEEHLPIEITAEIIDNVVSEAKIHYREVGEEEYHISIMARSTGDFFNGQIPGESVNLSGLRYFLQATDGLNSSTSPADTANPYEIEVTPDVTSPSISDVSANPNPFSPNGDGHQDTTLLTFVLSEPSFATVTVYDSSLQVQRELLQNLPCSSGENTTGWDGKNDDGQTLPNGSYTVRFECEDLSGHSATPVEIDVGIDALNQRKLDIIFLFHFNQNLVPYGKVANTACYVGLLETLRAHPQSKFLIHISGSLINDLLWFDDRAIQLIREGVEEGQFEILGSTYIQNVMYSTRLDSLDFQFNDKQIKRHKELIEKVLGVVPKGFWNPERTWTQNFVQLLADNGYEYVQVEDHILLDSGISGSEYLVRTTSYNGRELVVFTDEKTFQSWVNWVIDFGDYSGLIDFLHQLHEEDSADRYAVCYHEDAEATGLWDYESGENPEIDWEHLDSLITLLENDPLLEITTYEEWLETHEPAEEVTPIVDGAAQWMGGDNWFQENESENMNSYRAFFDEIRDRLNEVAGIIEGSSEDTLAASRLLKYAWNTLCAHQYEFGCHGLTEHSGFTDWDLARCALVSAKAAEYALNPTQTTYRDDINGDSVEEVVLVTPTDMWVFSPYGGRLLYWFDLEGGEELVGNENFMYYGENYVSDNRYVPPLSGGVDTYTWLSGNYIFPEVFEWTFEIRRRALNDWIELNSTSMGNLVERLYQVSVEDQLIEFHYPSEELDLWKSVTPSASGLRIVYTFQNNTSNPLDIRLKIENGFSPSCGEVMDGGRNSLQYWDGSVASDSVTPSTFSVRNMNTGSMVAYEFDSLPSNIVGEEDVFGLELNPIYEYVLEGYQSKSITFSLLKWVNSPPDTFSLILPVDGCTTSSPIQFDWYEALDSNPEDTILYTLYLSPDTEFSDSSTLVIDSIGTSECEVTQISSGVYYWKVRAFDSWGASRWSNQIWSFTVSDNGRFIRGDSNSDNQLNTQDAIFILRYKFVPGSLPPSCLDAADANDNGLIELPDASLILRYKFIPGSPPPPPPFPDCGPDPTLDELSCESHPCMAIEHSYKTQLNR